jgi:hypothetical protein
LRNYYFKTFFNPTFLERFKAETPEKKEKPRYQCPVCNTAYEYSGPRGFEKCGICGTPKGATAEEIFQFKKIFSMSDAEREAYNTDLLRMFKTKTARRLIDKKHGLIPE